MYLMHQSSFSFFISITSLFRLTLPPIFKNEFKKEFVIEDFLKLLSTNLGIISFLKFNLLEIFDKILEILSDLLIVLLIFKFLFSSFEFLIS